MPERPVHFYMPQDERDLLTRLQERYREHHWGAVTPGWMLRWALQALATESGIKHDFRERLIYEAFGPDPVEEIKEKAKHG